MSSCELSAQSGALSTILAAFIGSIINGLTSGYLVAFITGWISWFAALRILSGALLSLYRAFSSDYTPSPTASQTNDHIALEERGLIAETSLQGPAPQVSNNNTLPVENERKGRSLYSVGSAGYTPPSTVCSYTPYTVIL